ncbi:MAG: bifunctional DNA-formamidopyrimidine glycosylase/DNA-(apurinic or apyrimidinic site) lyase [Sedimentisphaerales bacterium]|nr:bifunctional DNA-formamidopyrimidine glycosylase/DNA-(apurinic or apyrimidinic site) lyase [Sedimentisphaerales bacterium]
MPELPEVENIAEGLRNEVLGLRIVKIRVNQPLIIRGPHRHRWRGALADYLGKEIIVITRRGKRLMMVTADHKCLLIQLGMTGKFLINNTGVRLPRHAHFYIDLNDGRQLCFIDTRRFGRLWLVDELDPADPDPAMCAAGLSRLGPEPFDISPSQFRNLLASPRLIKTLLLDQGRIAGLGNIYVDESLFAAGIHPATIANQIPVDKANRLRRAIRSVLKRAIARGGTTFSDFRNAYGDMGRFRKFLRVYHRTGLPCKKCRRPIHRVVITGRSSHFCPQCQR